MRLIASLFILSCLLLASCRSQRLPVQNYVEDLSDTTMRLSRFMAEPIIQKNDLLSIRIYSAALDPRIDALYNLQEGGSGAGSQGTASGSGYLVDQQGNIELPRIGAIKAEGLTKAQLATQIKQKLGTELQDPSVIIRFSNFRVIVMGEVTSPGVQTVPVENLTVLEALAMAGDITQFGKKKQVKVLRENNNQRQLGIIDVTSSRMFNSPYYQLQQNDVILVEATNEKARNVEEQRLFQRVSVGLSVVTTLAILYNIFRR